MKVLSVVVDKTYLFTPLCWFSWWKKTLLLFNVTLLQSSVLKLCSHTHLVDISHVLCILVLLMNENKFDFSLTSCTFTLLQANILMCVSIFHIYDFGFCILDFTTPRHHLLLQLDILALKQGLKSCGTELNRISDMHLLKEMLQPMKFYQYLFWTMLHQLCFWQTDYKSSKTFWHEVLLSNRQNGPFLEQTKANEAMSNQPKSIRGMLFLILIEHWPYVCLDETHLSQMQKISKRKHN